MIHLCTYTNIPTSMNQIEERTEVFKILAAGPIVFRLAHLLLVRSPIMVTKLNEVVNDIDQSGVSRILRRMRTLGLVMYQREGTSHLYELTEKGRGYFESYLSDIFSDEVFEQDLKEVEK